MGVVKSRSMEVTAFSDTRVAGTVIAAEDGVMMLTTPYDKGWRVKVDGEEVETRAVDDGFLSFDLTAGVHDIEMRYMPEWFLVGLMISLASLLTLILLQLVLRRRQNSQPLSQSASIRPFVPGQMHARPAFEDLDQENDHDVLYGDETPAVQPVSDPDETPAAQPVSDADETPAVLPASDADETPAVQPVDSADDEPYARTPDSWDDAETEKTGDAPKAGRPAPF